MSITFLVGLLSLAERVEVERPWLSAYDPDGNILWELRAATIRGTAGGWVAEDAVAYLYGDGELLVTARIPEVTADPTGQEWYARGEVTGEGEGLSFVAEEVRWANGELKLKGLRLVSRELELRALSASWESGGIWRLLGVKASFGDWELEFVEGVYDQSSRTLEIPGRLVARGWGWEVEAERARVHVDAERVVLWGVEIGPA